MERLCEYCQSPFIPKRIDTVYCCHSCRQMAYMDRKAKTVNGIDALKLKYKPDPSIAGSGKDETSNKTTDPDNYPSIKTANTVEPSIDKSGEEQKTSSNEAELNTKPSIEASQNINPSINETEKNVKPYNKKTSIDAFKNQTSPAVNKTSEIGAEYVEVESPFVRELIELTNERDNITKLMMPFYENSSAVGWISVRYKCLVECLLTFSEMKNIEVDDLKEVCNAFTSMIQSRYFNSLPKRYPYIKEILETRNSIKEICSNADENEPLKFILTDETRKKMIATRWELSYNVPKINFSRISFKE